MMSNGSSGKAVAQRKHDAVVTVMQDNVYHRILITQLNQYACDLTGYAKSELKDQILGKILPPDVQRRLEDGIEYETGSTKTLGAVISGIPQFRICSRDHTMVPVYCQVLKLESEDINPRYQLILRDDSLRRDIIERRDRADDHLDSFEDGTVSGLPGRDALEASLEMVLYHLRNRSMEAAFALLRIDNFDAILRGYGQQTGSVIMRGLGTLCSNNMRGEDTVTSYDGETIALILVGADRTGAEAVLNRLRFLVSSNSIPISLYDEIVVTLSIGLYLIQPGDSIEVAYDEATLALETAREKGGDSVVVG